MTGERTARAAIVIGILVSLSTLSGVQGAAEPEETMGRASGAVSAARPEPQSPIATQAPSPPQTSTASLPPRAAAQSAGSTQAEKPALPSPVVVILDPAHGGADNGAHGGPGDEDVIEKDLVLAIAQTMRREMERQGVRVVLTRQGDASVSLDERAALANGFGPSFFVSLHVASAGEANTAQAYSFGTPLGAAPPFSLPRAAGTGAVRWEDAQAAYLVPSRRLAELVQVELAQKLRGSPDVPQFAQVRQLRIVAHPAVAIELSSVAEENAGSLEKTAVPLANALMRAIAAYRQPSEVRP